MCVCVTDTTCEKKRGENPKTPNKEPVPSFKTPTPATCENASMSADKEAWNAAVKEARKATEQKPDDRPDEAATAKVVCMCACV